MIVVDDASTDGTLDKVSELSKTHHVRGIDRTGKVRSLSLSVIEGFETSEAEMCVVMDADMSHPIDRLAEMISPILEDKVDITVGSRNIPGGGAEKWPWHRILVSRVAGSFAYGLTTMTDPTSGFMGIRRSLLKGIALNPIGWKIVLETVFMLREKRILEVPIMFKDREYGASKLGLKEQIDFFRHLASLYKRKYVELYEFIKFSLVGLSGVVVDLLAVFAGLSVLSLDIYKSNLLGFVVALTSNYVLNRYWSFRYGKHMAFFKGYVLFCAVCSFGLVVRLVLINKLLPYFGDHVLILSAMGIVVAAVVNFLGSRLIVFKKG